MLIGRDAEVARLEAAIGRAAAGQRAAAVVAGEAGIGKTRLVTDVLGRATALGAVALAGSSLDVGEGVLAYAPVVAALRPLGPPGGTPVGALGNYGPRLLPEAAIALLSLGRREEAGELLAEALLAVQAPRAAARTALARAWAHASTSGARLLATEIQPLARRTMYPAC